MASRWFTVDELNDMDLPWTAEFTESRGRDKWGENVDLVFRYEWTQYHVLMHFTPGGDRSYPDAINIEGLWVVDCPEVELYPTRRHVVQFRKVTDEVPL